MIDPDVEARRMFIQERRADLALDAHRAEDLRPEPTESRVGRRRRLMKLRGLRLQLRAARP